MAEQDNDINMDGDALTGSKEEPKDKQTMEESENLPANEKSKGFTGEINQSKNKPNIEDILDQLTKVIQNDKKHSKSSDGYNSIENLVKSFLEIIDLNKNAYQSIDQNDSDIRYIKEFVKNIKSFLTIPAIIMDIQETSPQALELVNENDLFKIALSTLLYNFDFIQDDTTSIQALCILANMIHLSSLNESVLIENLIDFCSLMTKLLKLCKKNCAQCYSQTASWTDLMDSNNNDYLNKRLNVVGLQKNRPKDVSYNPILGWLERDKDISLDAKRMTAQLSNLWKSKYLKLLFTDLVRTNEDGFEHVKPSSRNPTVQFSWWTYAKPRFLGGMSTRCRLLTPEAHRIGAICHLLHSAIDNLVMMRQEILTNICMHHYILLNLWTFIKSLGPNNGLVAYLELLPQLRKNRVPEYKILAFFCECASNLINVLDESELYELQKPFKLEDLLAISSFLNNFVYQVLCYNTSNWSCETKSEIMYMLVQTPHKLLKDLYTRDCRRRFAPKEHWFVKELKVSSFLKDIEAKKLNAFKVLQMIPHIIPNKERIQIFRKFVSMDKLVARPSTLISIHRSRIVEDGYQQLARLGPEALKGLIRVKFINDFGLGEAGIDQDGVFKEFLEDTMKRVFDPTLNLFKATSEQCLYPSPTSSLHENYESLFNFVGKMLAKAIYEGIMVDIPFAPFFLRRVVGQPQNALYSPLDELPSYDPELFKSLTYIKHYEGDVNELELTFCIDTDFMGKIETHELEPGGRSTPVTRENRVRYIHLVADFHLRKQIAKQTNSFIKGFQSIIEPGWLSMFSATDLQNLISGDNTPIDLYDLRKNTKYSGGFHNNHRVISWLWDILEKDFTAEEHKLFLKFTTSCSKPPLLGFSNLEPPFSIRCIEVSDDLDLGDTLGSIMRGFLAIRRSDPVDRLPTSSTCFNLLKLPNYQQRSTLKEKLRYAIHSNAGFELS